MTYLEKGKERKNQKIKKRDNKYVANNEREGTLIFI